MGRILTVLAAIVGFSHSLFAQKADDVVGVWLVAKEDAKIEIMKRGDQYFGKIVWLKDSLDARGRPLTDLNGKEMMQMEIMKNFEFDDGEWVDGTVYDAEEGKTYYGTLEMPDDNTLELRGSLDRFGLLGRTEEWTRAKK
jgi:uncharacterized protein (DUF2147 family)